MRFLLVICSLSLLAAIGCSDPTPATDPPKPEQGTARPRPNEKGEMPKGGMNVPKGAMKPVAD